MVSIISVRVCAVKGILEDVGDGAEDVRQSKEDARDREKRIRDSVREDEDRQSEEAVFPGDVLFHCPYYTIAF